MKWILALLALAPMAAQAYTFDNDVPAAIKEQITKDMEFISQLQGTEASKIHGEIFGATVDGLAYQQFMESRVESVGMNGCGDPKAVACVNPRRDSSKIWLTQNYVRFRHPQIAKMMIIFHEARHTEVDNGNWMHAYCPSPFVDADGNEIKSIWTGAALADEAACDDTAYGSYASSMIMLKNISKFCTNCTEKVMQDAGLYADNQFLRVIDQDSIDAIRNDLYETAVKSKRRRH